MLEIRNIQVNSIFWCYGNVTYVGEENWTQNESDGLPTAFNLWAKGHKGRVDSHSKQEAQCLRRFLGTVGQNPSVSKSNQFHVVRFQIFLL